jgi:transmembrane sensor
MARECLAWQARSAAHREAFERCTDTWQDVARITLSSYAAVAAGRGTSARWTLGPSLRWAAVAVVMLFVVGLAVLQPWRDIETYATGIGEQQTVVLRDGTRMTLNTDTHLRVELAAAQRDVRLIGGEALFEVAKDARRPFVVQAAGSQVTAVGTVFSVRHTPEGASNDALEVTLLEGQVSVRPFSGESAGRVDSSGTLLLQAGERVRLDSVVDRSLRGGRRATTHVDRPPVDQMIAWRRNEAVFDDASLAQAVAEMNRYSPTPVVLVDDGALADLRVSGLFHTGDSAGFARAVAALHGLVVRERPDRLELASR